MGTTSSSTRRDAGSSRSASPPGSKKWRELEAEDDTSNAEAVSWPLQDEKNEHSRKPRPRSMPTKSPSTSQTGQHLRDQQQQQESLVLDPSLQRSLSKLYLRQNSSGRLSTASPHSHATENTHQSGHSSSINDAFGEQVTNPACGYGHLRFINGAIFQGTVCNLVEAMSEHYSHPTGGGTQRPATFLTSGEECVHGTWIFQRLQYDLDSMSPVAVYSLFNAHILTEDGSVYPYQGPGHLLLKFGIIRLPLARHMLKSQLQTREQSKRMSTPSPTNTPTPRTFTPPPSTTDSGPTTSAPSTPPLPRDISAALEDELIEYAKYPLISPRRAAAQISTLEQNRRHIYPAFSQSWDSLKQSHAAEFKAVYPPPLPPLFTPSPVMPGRRGTATDASNPNFRVHRDHRMIFWSLCGKEMAPSKWDDAINSDLRRTHFHRFVDREPHVAREQLHSILRYVALAFPSIGYCQGMHCVAKYLLLFSEAPLASSSGRTSPEPASAPAVARPRASSSENITSSIMLETERAFVLFAQLLEDRQYRLCALFDQNTEFYREILEDIDQRIANVEPVLYSHLQSCGLSAVVYAAKWILTVFTFYVDQDFASVTNVWLRFLSQGWDAIIDIAVACVCCVKEHLMNSDAEACLLVLSGTTAATPYGILELVFGTQRGQALLRAPMRALGTGKPRLPSNTSDDFALTPSSPATSRLPPPPHLAFNSNQASNSANENSSSPDILHQNGIITLVPVDTSASSDRDRTIAELKASPKVVSRLAPMRRHTGEESRRKPMHSSGEDFPGEDELTEIDLNDDDSDLS